MGGARPAEREANRHPLEEGDARVVRPKKHSHVASNSTCWSVKTTGALGVALSWVPSPVQCAWQFGK